MYVLYVESIKNGNTGNPMNYIIDIVISGS